MHSRHTPSFLYFYNSSRLQGSPGVVFSNYLKSQKYFLIYSLKSIHMEVDPCSSDLCGSMVSCTHNSSKQETTQIPRVEWVSGLWYSPRNILSNSRNEQCKQSPVGGPHNIAPRREDRYLKEDILYESTCTKNKNRHN